MEEGYVDVGCPLFEDQGFDELGFSEQKKNRDNIIYRIYLAIRRGFCPSRVITNN